MAAVGGVYGITYQDHKGRTHRSVLKMQTGLECFVKFLKELNIDIA